MHRRKPANVIHRDVKNKIGEREEHRLQNHIMGGSVGDIAVILQRFGDEQSTLLDQYERLSFEVRLNQAILGRSLSEPSTLSSRRGAAVYSMAPPPQAEANHQVSGVGRARRRKLGFKKVLQRLFKPILGRVARKDIRDHQKDIKLWKTFSRSLRY